METLGVRFSFALEDFDDSPHAERRESPPHVRRKINSLSTDMECSVLAGLLAGLTEMPHGSERSEQCNVRRAEIREALGQIASILDGAESKIVALKKEVEPPNSSELALLSDRVVGAEGMARGLYRGARVLHALEHSEEHEEMLRDIGSAASRASDVSAVLDIHRTDIQWKVTASAYDSYDCASLDEQDGAFNKIWSYVLDDLTSVFW
uniref:Uncharacterized protein n=1 Tax=Noctiluca scintillans TaxID=2966 RepID=A0A7S1ARB9_NOCSC